MLGLVSLVFELEKLKPFDEPLVVLVEKLGCAEEVEKPVALDPHELGIEDCVFVEELGWLKPNDPEPDPATVVVSAGLVKEAGVLLCPKENPLLPPLPATWKGVGIPNFGLSSLGSSFTGTAA